MEAPSSRLDTPSQQQNASMVFDFSGLNSAQFAVLERWLRNGDVSLREFVADPELYYDRLFSEAASFAGGGQGGPSTYPALPPGSGLGGPTVFPYGTGRPSGTARPSTTSPPASTRTPTQGDSQSISDWLTNLWGILSGGGSGDTLSSDDTRTDAGTSSSSLSATTTAAVAAAQAGSSDQDGGGRTDLVVVFIVFAVLLGLILLAYGSRRAMAHEGIHHHPRHHRQGHPHDDVALVGDL